MLKKLFLILLCFALCFSVGCSKDKKPLDVDQGDKIEEQINNTDSQINPLTGLNNLENGKRNQRPVAIMVNNISIAQPVQTGLYGADIVYETEVEGGITRLLAVYQDISKIEKIGTVRSARYVYIDLALGHNAIYVHHGQDGYHAQPHFKDVDHFTVDRNAGGTRISNGLASEHTLYALGDKLVEALKSQKFNFENKNTQNWVNFEEESKNITLENTANSVKVPFSNSYVTNFKYNNESGKYTRFFGNTERKDYVTKESLEFKNIFVLKTTIRTYPNCTDGYKHKEVQLDSGEGYYLVNGTYTPIKWSKGAADNGFKFTKQDGTELTVNAGNSWVCLVDSSANITLE